MDALGGSPYNSPSREAEGRDNPVSHPVRSSTIVPDRDRRADSCSHRRTCVRSPLDNLGGGLRHGPATGRGRWEHRGDRSDDPGGLRLRASVQGGGTPLREADALSGLRGEPDHRADAGLELERGGPGRGPVVVVSERSAGPVRVGWSHCKSAPATRNRCERRSFRRSPSMIVEVERKDASGREALARRWSAADAEPYAGRRLWALAGVVAASAVLALGVLGWMRAASPGPGERLPARGPAAPRDGGRGTAGQGAGDARDRGGASTVPGRAATHGPTAATARARLHLPDRGRPQAMAALDGRRGQGGPRRHRQPQLRARHRAQPRLCRGHRRGRRPRGQAASAISAPITPNRPAAQVKGDIDAWVRFYPRIAGFFLDQQPREAGHAAYFVEIGAHARSKLRDAIGDHRSGRPLRRGLPGPTCLGRGLRVLQLRGLRLVRDPGQPQGLRPFPLCRPGLPGRGRRGHELDAQGGDHQAASATSTSPTASRPTSGTGSPPTGKRRSTP